jgi:hypothetical protein
MAIGEWKIILLGIVKICVGNIDSIVDKILDKK